MDMVHTIMCKLDPTPEQASELDATLQAFADACNHIAEVARRIHSHNKVIVQHACYREVRETFGLSANLAIRAIARVCAALKVPENAASTFAPTSIDYDQRIFSFREADWTFSLTLLHARERLATTLGAWQKTALQSRHPTSAQLVKRRDGRYFLHIQLTDLAPDPIAPSDVIGVDLGVKNLAVTDEGQTFSGDDVEQCRQRYGSLRKALNQCGSKSARRHLRKIRRREANFRKDTNHLIGKRIVAKAKDTSRAIALEDLQGINDRTTARKAQRNRLKGWAFYQLRSFISYKALRAAIPVLLVDPRNTSRTCSMCGHCEKGNRKSRDAFECKHCGYSAPADCNAAKNIRLKALKADVMLPIVGVHDPSLEPGGDCLQAAGL